MIDGNAFQAVMAEVLKERESAHVKHGAKSAEETPWTSPLFMTILTEEIGEVAKAINDFRYIANMPHKLARELRKELIQVTAMSTAWIAAIDESGTI